MAMQPSPAMRDREREPAGKVKVVVRHLPPTLKEEAFLEALPKSFAGRYSWFAFFPGKSSHKRVVHSRAYFNFKKPEDVFEFAEAFQGHIFANERGVQFKALVEYAPFQRVPKQSRKDAKEGTIFEDEEYLNFVAALEKPIENLPSAEVQLERKEAEKAAAGVTKEPIIVTPLMEYVRQKRAAKLAPSKLPSSLAKQALGGSRSAALLPSHMHYAAIGNIQQRRGVQDKLRSDAAKSRENPTSPNRPSPSTGREEAVRDRDMAADRRRKDSANETREKKLVREAMVAAIGPGRPPRDGGSSSSRQTSTAAVSGQGGGGNVPIGGPIGAAAAAISGPAAAARAAAAAALAGGSIAGGHATGLLTSSPASSPRHDSATHRKGHGETNHEGAGGGLEESTAGVGAGRGGGRWEGPTRKPRQQGTGRMKEQAYDPSAPPVDEEMTPNTTGEELEPSGIPVKGNTILSKPLVSSPVNQRREGPSISRPPSSRQTQPIRQQQQGAMQHLPRETSSSGGANSASMVKLLSRPAADQKGSMTEGLTAAAAAAAEETSSPGYTDGESNVNLQPPSQSGLLQSSADARRLRNKDRPDRPVWTPRRRADGVQDVAANGSGGGGSFGQGVIPAPGGETVGSGSAAAVKPPQNQIRAAPTAGLLSAPATIVDRNSSTSGGTSVTVRQGRGGPQQQRSTGRGQLISRGGRGEFAGSAAQGLNETNIQQGVKSDAGGILGSSAPVVASTANPQTPTSQGLPLLPGNDKMGAGLVDGGVGSAGGDSQGSFNSPRYGPGRGGRGGFRGGGGRTTASGANWKNTSSEGDTASLLQGGGGALNGVHSNASGAGSPSPHAGDVQNGGGSPMLDKDRRMQRASRRGGHSSNEGGAGNERIGRRGPGLPSHAGEKQVWVAVQKPGPSS